MFSISVKHHMIVTMAFVKGKKKQYIDEIEYCQGEKGAI